MKRNPESKHHETGAPEKAVSEKPSGRLPEGTAEQAKKLTPAKRRDFYKKNGLDTLADNEAAISAQHKSPGLSYRPCKLNSDNFEKYADNKNYSKKDRDDLRHSFSKWSPDARNDEKLRKEPTEAKHGRKGDRFLVTDNGPGKRASGRFLTKESLGPEPEERIAKGALQNGNRATDERPVRLKKNQDLIAGTIAPQHGKGFDGDGIERVGGGKQYVTDGGYKNGAIEDVDKSKKGGTVK